jgi:hypothetical protein
MTFQEIRIIATGPCIANQLRDINTICRRSWYIAAHVWKIYDFKIEVVLFIINFRTGYWTRAIKRFALFDLLKSLYSDTKILSKYILSAETIISDAFSYSENV